MPGRVNTKFLLTLIVVTAALVGSAVSYYYYFVRTDPSQLVARGDRYASQGLYEQALSQYSKAIEELPNDVPLQMKLVDVLSRAKTSDPRTAKTYIGLMIRTLQRVITMQPHNLKPFEQLMEMYIRMGRDMGDFSVWQKMYEDSDARLRTTSDPAAELLAKKYRGIARVNSMEQLDFTADQRLQARTDLEAVLAQHPDDRDVTYYLAGWRVLEARALERAGGQQDLVAEHYREADRLSAAALAAHHDDPRRQLDRIKILGLLGYEKNQDDILALTRRVEQRLLANPSPLRWVLELVEILVQTDRRPAQREDSDREATTSGLLRAEKLLNVAIEANPDEPRYIASLGRVLEMQKRYDDAMAQYKRLRQLQPLSSPFEGVHLERLRAGVSVKYANLLLRNVESASPQQRDAAIDECQAIIDEVAVNHGESGEVNLIRGKIALLRGQWGEASKKLDQANGQFKGTKPEALLLSAKAWVKLGELGAATDRLEQLVRIRPAYLKARYELINLYLGLDQYKAAKKHLDVILNQKPDDRTAMRLKARLLSRQGRTEEAIELYLTLDPKQDPSLINPLASLYVDSGRPQIAKQLLLERFSEAPTDIETLQALIRLSDDPQQTASYIEQARQAGADPKAIEILQSQFAGASDMTKVLEELIDAEKDPFNRSLKRYHLYRRLGQPRRASEALAQAATLNPDHPAVISIRFNEALLGGHWEQAQALAGRAASLNLDLADGMFYYGRLEAQRGRYEEAITNYQRGLNQRPIYSDGWRMLGDAQRLNAQWVDAESSYRRALEQRPNNTEALRGLVIVLDAQGKYDEVLANLRRRVRFSSNNRALREQYLSYEQRYGDINKALAMRRQIAASDPDDVTNRRALAVLLSQAGLASDAQKEIDRLIEQTGVDRDNMLAAAIVKKNAGDVKRAQAILRDYIHGLGPGATDVDWLVLARFLMGIGDENQALAAYRRAVELEDPSLRRATRELADVLFGRGAYAEAEQRYEQLWQTSSDDKRVGYRYVETLLRVNKPGLAGQILEKVKQQHGVDGEVYLLEAMLARATGDLSGALASLNRAAELSPRRAMIYYQRADLQASDPDRELAVLDDLHKALELDPDMVAARRLLAMVHIRRGEHDEAIRELTALVKRHPENIAVRLQLAGLYENAGMWAQRRALLDESEKMFPAAAIWPQLKAQQALRENNEAEAVEQFKRAFELAPSPQTLRDLASLLIKVGDAQEALTVLRGNGEIVREVPVLHALRGRSLVVLGSDDLARRAFTRAVERCKTFEQMSAVSSQMAQAIGVDESISMLEALSAESQSPLIELGMVKLEVEDKRNADAMERLKRIDALVPESSGLRTVYNQYLALVLYQNQAFEQALEVYKKVLESQPNNVMTLNNTAYMLAQDMNRPQEAVPLARRAAKMAPNNATVLDTYGWSLFKAGQVDDAFDILHRSVRMAPSGLSCLHLAEVQLKRGDSQSAIETLNRSVALAEASNDERTQWLAKKRLDELSRYSGP